MIALIERTWRSDVFWQMVRFGLTGGLLTVLVAGAYWLMADLFHVPHLLSMTLSYMVVSGLGYVLHSRFSFRGHGSRDNPAARTARFFTVNTIGFLANQLFVWFFVLHLGGPTWWSVVPIVLVTPLLTFSLNRIWVFA